ncbi:sugar transferase [Mucilaginibacter boryungensis]|uniref:Sugar transferase n=1 Tax=Mucilaginibacter boryungensis TaxID=768480 RepID=A0ABR9XBY0_9SPHI|nr:sugar transferase [Mucilaginibacter boryungensis]MBE9664889.1 sugar transferase [Mucilaginibacter boryungensis]
MTYITTDWNESAGLRVKLAYAGTELRDLIFAELPAHYQIFASPDIPQLDEYLAEQSILSMPDIIVAEVDEAGETLKFVERIKKNNLFKQMLIVLVSKEQNLEVRQQAIKLKVNDLYAMPINLAHLRERLNFLVNFKLIKPTLSELSKKVDTTYTLPPGKRFMDIFFSGMALLLLSPIFIFVAIAIKLGSKGPIIYKSKRVGTGYKVFDFYKFRSMRSDADQLLAKLSVENNQYAAETTEGKSASFVKIKNDPRITRLGAFLRSTSIDELPQFFNILKGDMSIVGNRPLPVYEAEMLTSNEWAMRFLGPAGLTGLWQVTKRGKDDMSERERKKLDNFYAQNYSLLLDLKIILSTIPALFQKEKV